MGTLVRTPHLSKNKLMWLPMSAPRKDEQVCVLVKWTIISKALDRVTLVCIHFPFWICCFFKRGLRYCAGKLLISICFLLTSGAIAGCRKRIALFHSRWYDG
ncbi:hypothetical protein CEXT_635751 [Caerostris extrusa]|uniref:Uncharacterized protein n=1 Tax=Caerostris extrusa TaxID=172846 RepID=A0AAV4RQ61_CAEEX|nr:hypothetical protein CEXT_635751 [Caerostris extrusa]